MNDELRQDEVIAYVLGEMSEAETALFQGRIARDPEARAFVDEMNESAATLALALPPVAPPPAVLQNLLREVRSSAPGKKVVRGPWLPWAIAAALAITSAVLGWNHWQARQELTALRERDALAQVRIATLGAKAKEYEKTVAVIVWDSENQRGVLKLAELPPLEAGRDYQLWVIDSSSPQPVSAGVITTAPDGVSRMAFHPIQQIRGDTQFAVSIERKGGSSSPQGQIVLAGK